MKKKRISNCYLCVLAPEWFGLSLGVWEADDGQHISVKLPLMSFWKSQIWPAGKKGPFSWVGVDIGTDCSDTDSSVCLEGQSHA